MANKEDDPSHVGNQNFTASVATIFKMEDKRVMDAGSEKEDQRRKCFKVDYNTGARATSSDDRLQINISDKRTNRKAYSEMSEEQAYNSPPWCDVTLGNNVKRNKPKPEREVDVPIPG